MAAARHPRAARAHAFRRSLARGVRTLPARLRATPRPLALVLVAAALLGVAWAVVLPPFQGPDESEHFAYVQHLAETGEIPSATATVGAGSHSSEQHTAQSELGLRMLMGERAARPMWNAYDQERWRAYEDGVTERQRGDGGGPNPIAKNPPLYYAYEAVAYHASPSASLYAKLLTTRLANVLLFLATIVFVWLAAAELTTRVWARTLAAGAVALQPQLASTAGIVNADTLLVTIWSAFVALAARTLRRGPSGPRVIGLCLLGAASALTHGRGIALLPPLAIVLGLSFWRHRPALRSALRWSAGGLLVLACAALLFRLFGTNGGGGQLYGGQTNYVKQGGFDPLELFATVWQFYLPKLPLLPDSLQPYFGFREMYVETFYGSFGWLEVRFPARVYSLLLLASVLGLAALAACAWVRRRELRRSAHVAIGLASVALSLIALLHLVSYLSLLGSGDTLIVGRYLLPLVSLFGLAIAFVATSLPRRLGPLLAGGVLGVGLVLQLTGLAMTMERFHA